LVSYNVDQNICGGGFSADLYVVADVMILEKRSKSSELVVTFKGMRQSQPKLMRKI
jgi:hypothetical protein